MTHTWTPEIQLVNPPDPPDVVADRLVTTRAALAEAHAAAAEATALATRATAVAAEARAAANRAWDAARDAGWSDRALHDDGCHRWSPVRWQLGLALPRSRPGAG